MMSGLYSIPLAGLREGRYTYDFSIGNDFFEPFKESEIRRGELIAEVVLDKRSSHLELLIKISGSAEVTCDRCLELFYIKVSCTNKLYVKQGKEWDDTDPEIIIMPVEQQHFDMSQFFYEFIHLALPIKRTHPDDSKGNSTCDPEMIRNLEDHLITGENNSDPRWDELRKLKKIN
jgi:uncharacterized metal-binding protein YceD (DUF177 family)